MSVIKSTTLYYRITLLEPMLGTIPKNPEIFTRHIQTEKTGPDELEAIPEGQELGYTGFMTYEPGNKWDFEPGIYLFNYHIKGFLKEAANILKGQMEPATVPEPKKPRRKKGEADLPVYEIPKTAAQAAAIVQEVMEEAGKPAEAPPVDQAVLAKLGGPEGIKNLRNKVLNWVYVWPRRIYLQLEPDGCLERPLMAMTKLGPRVSLAKSDYVNEGLTFDVEVEILDNPDINEETIDTLMSFGKYKGLGQWRNASWGSFSFKKISHSEFYEVRAA